jgi:PKD repeat protein
MLIWWSILACQRKAAPPSAPPVATLVAQPTQGAPPLQVTLEALRPAGLEPLSFSWDLGDGSRAEGRRVEHRYKTAGTYEVHLVVTDARGASNDVSSLIEVTAPSCPTGGTPTVTGVLTDTGLDELSGMAMSRRSDGTDRIWVHEDKQAEELVALDAAGVVHARRQLVGVQTVDTEDLATVVDPQTGVAWLYLGDIGDNDVVRESIAVYLMEEPDPNADGEVYPSAVELQYPDGAHDAEALLVDPRTMDLYVITKVLSGGTGVYRKAAPHDTTGLHTLEQVSTLSLEGGVTGGDFAPDGAALVLRTYLTTAWLWRRQTTVSSALLGAPCAIPIASEPQGEAITFEAAGLRTVSEGVGASLYQIPLQGL